MRFVDNRQHIEALVLRCGSFFFVFGLNQIDDCSCDCLSSTRFALAVNSLTSLALVSADHKLIVALASITLGLLRPRTCVTDPGHNSKIVRGAPVFGH